MGKEDNAKNIPEPYKIALVLPPGNMHHMFLFD